MLPPSSKDVPTSASATFPCCCSALPSTSHFFFLFQSREWTEKEVSRQQAARFAPHLLPEVLWMALAQCRKTYCFSCTGKTKSQFSEIQLEGRKENLPHPSSCCYVTEDAFLDRWKRNIVLTTVRQYSKLTWRVFSFNGVASSSF